ncbi:MAG: hypothetical protein IJ083_17345 [Clostridia bacterium]|nr:hypothetical protein [Clostridia bacterium]
MFALLFLPFQLMAGMFSMVFSLVGGIFRGMFRMSASIIRSMFSLMFGLWPLWIIGGAVSLVLGLVRHLLPLILVGGAAMACVWLFKKGMADGKTSSGGFTDFVNSFRKA